MSSRARRPQERCSRCTVAVVSGCAGSRVTPLCSSCQSLYNNVYLGVARALRLVHTDIGAFAARTRNRSAIEAALSGALAHPKVVPGSAPWEDAPPQRRDHRILKTESRLLLEAMRVLALKDEHLADLARLTEHGAGEQALAALRRSVGITTRANGGLRPQSSGSAEARVYAGNLRLLCEVWPPGDGTAHSRFSRLREQGAVGHLLDSPLDGRVGLWLANSPSNYPELMPPATPASTSRGGERPGERHERSNPSSGSAPTETSADPEQMRLALDSA